MTEPVAYKVVDSDSEREFLRFTRSPFNKNIPLYTAEQLHPRVKMTQEEFIEFKKLKSMNSTLDLIAILRIVNKFNYPNLQSRLLCSIENQTEFAELWLKCRYERLEETIEIIPNKKWFVRVNSQIPLPDENIYLDDELIVYPHYNSPKRCAHQFETKEEAEKWTNPLTEAVQLPVEDE